MACYFLRSKHISRGKGARVTRAAAYRAGERIRDQRTSEVYDYSDRNDVACKEVVLPSELTGREDMAWTQDRAVLWNAAEHAGVRRNSRLAREFLVLVPPELAPSQRARLVRDFSQELADRYRCAVDMTLHAPRPGADARNHHAHLLMTVREVSPDGMGPRTGLELGGRERRGRGLGPAKEEYVALRERWAQLTNHALQRAGLAVRVDHRSYQAQGLNREPTATIPEKVFYAERRSGAGSVAGDEIRARHRERLEARGRGQEELERVIARQKAQLREEALRDLQRKAGEPGRARWASLTREERNALRREQYRARREIEKTDPQGEARRREAGRQRYHEAFRKDPEAMRERRREYRKTHSEEINRNQREFRKARSEELNRRRRELRRANAVERERRQRDYPEAGRSGLEPPAAVPPHLTPQDSAKGWLAERGTHGPEGNAGQSAADWVSSRAREAPESIAERAARDWLSDREGRSGYEAQQGLEESSPGRDSGRGVDADDDRQLDRRRDHDLER